MMPALHQNLRAAQREGLLDLLVHFRQRNHIPRLIDRGVFGHLVGQPLDRVGGDLGHLADAVLVPLQVDDLLVEDLPGELMRLVEDFAAVFGIGVIAKIGSFVAEPHAVRIDHDRERIAVLLEIVADREVAEFGAL